MGPPKASRAWSLGKALDLLASVRLAIPLLVLIATASVVGSLLPQGRNLGLPSDAPQSLRRLNDYLQLNDVFHSWWYLLLLALLGLSLLAVTVKRVPTVWRQRGRGPALGILLAHLGILFILGAMIHGGLAGFRYYTHLIEGEVTVLPELPFVIKLDRLDVKHFAPQMFDYPQPSFLRTEKQESTLTLLHHGTPFLSATAAPGRPLFARGATLLPSHQDIGWTFDLVLEAGGREKVVPVRPWAPPLITLTPGSSWRIFAHRLTPSGHSGDDALAEVSAPLLAEVFLLQDDGTSRSLGSAAQDQPLRFGSWTISVGAVRRHTGLHVYSRPERPLLVAGVVTLLVGLAGYFSRWGRRLVPSQRAGLREPALPGPSE